MWRTINFFDCCLDEVEPKLPEVKTDESACADLMARFHGDKVVTYNEANLKNMIPLSLNEDGTRYYMLYPGDRACIPTGWRVKIPHGCQIKLLPRSGMALKHGITLLNTPGTIDSDYTDELMVILYNASSIPYRIDEGDSVCQLEVVPNSMREVHFKVNENIKELEEHKNTSNRVGGFGSTGK